MPDVTVVIPTHNRWDLLPQTLNTVLAQRDVDLEVVVIDEASQDGTAEGLAQMTDRRIRVIRHSTPQGVARARNVGLDAATTPWVAVLDSDDLWTPDKLSSQLAAVAETGRAWAYSGAVTFTDGPVLWLRMDPPNVEETTRRLPWKNIIPAGSSNVLMRTDLARSLGGFDKGLQHLADWDMWLRLLIDGQPAVANGHTVAYRQHVGSMQTRPEGILAELEVLDERYRSLRGGEALDKGWPLRWIARSYLRSGQRAKARRALLDAYRKGTPRSPRYLVGAARTLIPIAPFPGRARDRLLGRPGPQWPPGMEQWLRTVTSPSAALQP